MFSKRTVTVWFCLFVSLTTVSGLLFVLEPAPAAPSAPVILTILDNQPESVKTIFSSTKVPVSKHWQAIVIHHSGLPYGNRETLSQQHLAEGKTGMGYHFVIGNGDQAEDGELQVGMRWMAQQPGHHGEGKNADWINRNAIGICLVGDGNMSPPTELQIKQLVTLVTALQKRLNIPDKLVRLQRDLAETSSPGRLFPETLFRRQLLP